MTRQLTAGGVCTGYGGMESTAEAVFGARVIWTAENDPGAALATEASFPGIPNLGDITEVDWHKAERPDIVGGGFPCQSISRSGGRAGMVAGSASGLWFAFAGAIAILRPRIVMIENVRDIVHAKADCDVEPCTACMGDPDSGPDVRARALGVVLSDLADLGFNAEWRCLEAWHMGYCHGRPRVFILAWQRGLAAA